MITTSKWPYALNHYGDRSIYQSNCIEFWAPITDEVVPNIMPDTFFVSSCGRVYSKKTNSIVERVRKLPNTTVSLLSKIGGVIRRRVDILVMMTFCYVDMNDPQYLRDTKNLDLKCALEIVHKDGDINNNNLYNLSWTIKEIDYLYNLLHKEYK